MKYGQMLKIPGQENLITHQSSLEPQEKVVPTMFASMQTLKTTWLTALDLRLSATLTV